MTQRLGQQDIFSDARALRVLIGGSGVTVARTGTALFTIDGTVTLYTGKLRIYNKSAGARTITRVWVSANTAPTGAALIVDIHLDGVTIFGTRPQVAAGANYGDTTTFATTAWGDGSYVTMDVDQVGATIWGADLTVGVEYSY